MHTKMVFNEKYENNVVKWNGYFAEVKRKENGLEWMVENKNYLSILVKM